MRAGYKIAPFEVKGSKIIVVYNFSISNHIENRELFSVNVAKRSNKKQAIGFWRIKRKETIKEK